ncbi:MAG: FAD/NAD(P)-binding oxidoreductase, partial [Actinomycetota bacterium]
MTKIGQGKTILILGGGSGGLVTANQLRRELPKNHQVVMVDQKPVHELAFSFLWLLIGLRDKTKVVKDLEPLKEKGIEFVKAKVENIIPSRKIVETDEGDMAYDYLVISLGARLAPEAIPGFSESAHNLYDLNGILKLKEEIEHFEGGNVVVLISSMPFKCPAAPYEATLLLDYLFREKDIRGKINLEIFTPEPQPMPAAGPVLGKALEQVLESRGIGFNPNLQVSSIDSTKNEIVFSEGQRAEFNLLIGIPPHRSPEAVQKSGLTNETGWIPVERETLKASGEDVFAIGDITTISLPGRYKQDKPLMLPKAGVFAHYQADVVAHNIAAEIKGSRSRKAFD